MAEDTTRRRTRRGGRLTGFLKGVGLFALGIPTGVFMAAVATDPADNLTLVESALTAEATGPRLLTGTLRNNTDSRYSHVQVGISLLDADGAAVGGTTLVADDIGPGQAWTFQAPVAADGAVRAIVEGQCGRRYDFRYEVASEDRRG